MFDENEMLKQVALHYEKKLIELMGEAEFEKYSTKIARDLFVKDLMSCPNKKFRDFGMSILDKIIGEDDNDKDNNTETV